MDCKQARNLFDAYLDGELSPALATELHAHRLGCASCRQELAVMEVAGHVIASGGDEPGLEADFSSRLLACLDHQVRYRPPVRTWIFRIGGVAAAAAVLVMLVGYWSRPESQVASQTENAPGQELASPSGAVLDEPSSPGFDQAAVTVRQTLEDAVRETHQSSDSLAHLGRMTLLQIAEALQAQEVQEFDDPHEPLPDDSPGDDAEDIQEL